MELSNNFYPIFIVHNSLYSVLVNIMCDACFYGYTALPNCFYLVNVFNFNVFLLSQFFYIFYIFFFIHLRNSHFLQLYTVLSLVDIIISYS